MLKTAIGLVGAALSIAVACGGSVDSGPNGSGAGPFGGSAGSAGSSPGGSSGSAGSAGSAGSDAGTDARTAPDCHAPPQSFSCKGGDGAFYFDQTTGVCKAYGLHHCSHDSANRFSSLADCLATCPGARPDVDACDDVSQCAIVDTGCCPACEPVGLESLSAVNSDRITDFRDPCPPIACAACEQKDELETTRQYFLPACYVGHCTIFDIRYTSYMTCQADSDCVLRDGAGCCEGCDGKGLVSLNKNQPLSPVFRPSCPDGDIACPECAPNIPPEYAAKCQEGYCRVTRTAVADAG